MKYNRQAASTSVIIRLATPLDDGPCGIIASAALMASDLPSVLAKARPIFEDHSPFPAEHGIRLIAEVEGNPIGFIDYSAITFHIHYLFVHPAFQSMGIGSQLSDSVHRSLAGFVTVSTLSANLRSLDFFKGRGYFEIHRSSQQNWHGEVVQWIRLRKRLP
jgi:GNAT superfamily N-acetyltransferase